MRMEVLADLERIIAAGVPDVRDGRSSHILVLNNYQVANLKSLIHATGYASVYKSPLNVIHNGDWVGELHWMLSKIDAGAPNATAEQLTKAANEYKSP